MTVSTLCHVNGQRQMPWRELGHVGKHRELVYEEDFPAQGWWAILSRRNPIRPAPGKYLDRAFLVGPHSRPNSMNPIARSFAASPRFFRRIVALVLLLAPALAHGQAPMGR